MLRKHEFPPILSGARSLFHSEKFTYFVAGLLLLLILLHFGHQLLSAKIKTYPDTASYKRTAQMIQDLQFLETRTDYRGQTFPLAYLLSVTSGISYAIVALLLNIFFCMLSILLLSNLQPWIRWIFLVSLLIGFTSHGPADFLTTYLTESLVYPMLALFVASALWIGISPDETKRLKIIKAGVCIVTIILLNSLKPWFLMIPGVFLFCYSLIYFARMILHRHTDRERFLRTLAICLVGIFLSRLIYSPGIDNTPSNNMGLFLKNYRSDLYVQEKLKQGDLSEEDRTRLSRAYTQAVLCLHDPTFGCRNSDIREVRKAFRDIYLKDYSGAKYLLQLFLKRWRWNLRIGESENVKYGTLPLIGHKLFSKLGIVLKYSLVLFLICLCLLAIRAVLGKEEHSAVTTILSISVTIIPLYAFLAVGSGRSEMPRVEFPAYYLYLLVIPLITAQALQIYFQRIQRKRTTNIALAPRPGNSPADSRNG
jgi:hypothetical protein